MLTGDVVESGMAARLRWAITRAVEIVLAVSGLSYSILFDESPTVEAWFLFGWGTLAATYLVIGWVRVRRQRHRDVPVPRRTGGLRRFSIFFTVAASLTGFGAALAVIANKDGGQDGNEVGSLVTGLGVVVVICAWLLLHVGYARFYAQWTDLRFPGTPEPQLVDFLYFSFTVGVSFASSDVEVRSRPLRWSVMVHSVVSFLYNAAVLAVAVGIITGK
jgi:uncharacterized membrane protein